MIFWHLCCDGSFWVVLGREIEWYLFNDAWVKEVDHLWERVCVGHPHELQYLQSSRTFFIFIFLLIGCNFFYVAVLWRM